MKVVTEEGEDAIVLHQGKKRGERPKATLAVVCATVGPEELGTK